MENSTTAVYSAEAEIDSVIARYKIVNPPPVSLPPPITSGPISTQPLPPIEEQFSLTVNEVKPFTKLFLNFAAQRMANPLPPSQTEVDNINSALTKVLNKRLPAILQKMSAEAILLANLAMFVFPRAQEQPKAETEKKAEGKK